MEAFITLAVGVWQIVVIVLLVLLLLLPQFLPRFYIYLLALIFAIVLLATSLNLVLGFGGMYQIGNTTEAYLNISESYRPQRFDDLDEVAKAANDTLYGLGASVWTKDLSTMHKLAAKIKSGSVWGNCHSMIDPALPFGGYKQSGVGREFGDEGLNEYTELKTLYVDDAKTRDKKPWYDMVVARPKTDS
mgnify:CR=1 FL=1